MDVPLFRFLSGTREKRLPYHQMIVSFNPYDARQVSKTGCAVWVGEMASFLSPVNHSDRSQSYVEEGRLCFPASVHEHT